MTILQEKLLNYLKRSVWDYLQGLKTEYTNAGYIKELKLITAFPDDYSKIYLPTISFEIGRDIDPLTSDIGMSIVSYDVNFHLDIFAGSISIEQKNQEQLNSEELTFLRGLCKKILWSKFIPMFDYSINPPEEQENGIEVKTFLSDELNQPKFSHIALRYRGIVDFNVSYIYSLI